MENMDFLPLTASASFSRARFPHRIMAILVDVKYVKVDIPEVQDNFPDDLRRNEYSKSESIATNKVTKEAMYYTKSIQLSVYLCV